MAGSSARSPGLTRQPGPHGPAPSTPRQTPPVHPVRRWRTTDGAPASSSETRGEGVIELTQIVITLAIWHPVVTGRPVPRSASIAANENGAGSPRTRRAPQRRARNTKCRGARRRRIAKLPTRATALRSCDVLLVEARSRIASASSMRVSTSWSFSPAKSSTISTPSWCSWILCTTRRISPRPRACIEISSRCNRRSRLPIAVAPRPTCAPSMPPCVQPPACSRLTHGNDVDEGRFRDSMSRSCRLTASMGRLHEEIG